jgi:quercetin dioxygenase-like cupin family protein
MSNDSNRAAGMAMNGSAGFADDEPALIDLAGGRLEVIARMGASDADTVLIRAHMAAGKVSPLHSHIDPELFYVLSGCVEAFVLDDKPGWHTIETGYGMLIVDGMKHAVRNTANQPADLMIVTNNRLARFFREAGTRATPGTEVALPTPEDIQRLIRVAETYGYWIASPEENTAVTG